MLELGKASIFEGLPEDEMARIEPEFEAIEYHRGMPITQRGRFGTGFMVILEGQVELELHGGRKVAFGPGDHIGEMAILNHQPRVATSVALTDVKLAGLPSWKFESLMLEHPRVAYNLLRSLSERLRQAEQWGSAAPQPG